MFGTGSEVGKSFSTRLFRHREGTGLVERVQLLPVSCVAESETNVSVPASVGCSAIALVLDEMLYGRQ